jgi:hypothetical protein
LKWEFGGRRFIGGEEIHRRDAETQRSAQRRVWRDEKRGRKKVSRKERKERKEKR